MAFSGFEIEIENAAKNFYRLLTIAGEAVGDEIVSNAAGLEAAWLEHARSGVAFAAATKAAACFDCNAVSFLVPLEKQALYDHYRNKHHRFWLRVGEHLVVSPYSALLGPDSARIRT